MFINSVLAVRMSLYHFVNIRFDFNILIYFLIGKELFFFVLLNQSA